MVIAKIVMAIMGAALAFTVVILTISVGAAVTVERTDLMAQLAEANAPGSAFPLILLMLVLIAAAIGLAAWFILLTWRIVDSVGQGDPFAEENADRLRSMGWATLLIQGLVIGATAIARWIATFVPEGEGYGEFGINGTGFLLPLVLFILARVFRLGTQMRDDLEGTV